MADEPSQEELLAQQKANCIFCKIVAGEIPSRRVYEDERMLAILDINPATKGHTLLMLKEHYPIMPLIPPEEFDHLFGRTAALSGAVAEGALAKRCTAFIANGAVAGQQSPHFLFHLIPREQGDGLEGLTPPKRGINQTDLGELMKRNLYAVMRQHLTKTGKVSLLQMGGTVAEQAEATTPQARPVAAGAMAAAPPAVPPPAGNAASPAQPRLSFAQLTRVIEENPEIKALLINNPEKLQGILDANPELQAIFQGVNILKLGEQLRKLQEGASAERTTSERRSVEAGEGTTEEVGRAAAEETTQEADEVRPASSMTLQEIFAFIDGKPQLREYILQAPGKLKELIPENGRLSRFFAGSNIDAIILAYQEHEHARRKAEKRIESPDGRSAAQMTLQEIFAFIDSKERLRKLILQEPERLKERIGGEEALARFFKGSNVNAIIQAYQEYAKATQDVHVTVEPDAKEDEEERPPPREPKGPSREESWDAWNEVRMSGKRANLDHISRLFR